MPNSSRSSMKSSVISNFCPVFGVYFLYGPLFLPLAPSVVICLATSSMRLLADSIQEEGSCLDKGPCRFGRQLLLVF